MNRLDNLTPILLIAGAAAYVIRELERLKARADVTSGYMFAERDTYVELGERIAGAENLLAELGERLERLEPELFTDEGALKGDEVELASFLDGVIQQSAVFAAAHEPSDEQKSAWFERPNDDYDLSNIRGKLALGVNGFRRNRVVVSGVAVAITDAQPNVYFGVVWVNEHNGIPPSIIQVVDAEQADGMIPRASMMMNVNAVIGNLISGGFLKTGGEFHFGQDSIVGLENLPKVRFLDIRDFAGSEVGQVG